MNTDQISQSVNLLSSLMKTTPSARADDYTLPSFSSFMPDTRGAGERDRATEKRAEVRDDRSESTSAPASARDRVDSPDKPDESESPDQVAESPVAAADDDLQASGEAADMVAAEDTDAETDTDTEPTDDVVDVTAEGILPAALVDPAAADAALEDGNNLPPEGIAVTAAVVTAGQMSSDAKGDVVGEDGDLVLDEFRTLFQQSRTQAGSLASSHAGAGNTASTAGSAGGLNPGFASLLNGGAVDKAMAQMVAAGAAKADGAGKALPAAATSSAAMNLSGLQARLAGDARAVTTQTSVQTPVGQPQWPAAVAEKVMWMSSQKISAADIRLDPPELGSLHVRVSVNNQDQTTVTFVSPHAAVREALDQNAFKLREMFSGEGLNLADVNVSDQSAAEQFSGEQGQPQRQAGADGNADLVEDEVISTDVQHQGLVSYYV